jgi:hypothetical protein
MVTLEEVFVEARRDNRICPQPRRWQELFDMLPDKRPKGASWEPAPPLILAAWWTTPAFLRMLRLREHIEWAAEHGCLDQIHSFLSQLPEDEWHHIGEK